MKYSIYSLLVFSLVLFSSCERTDASEEIQGYETIDKIKDEERGGDQKDERGNNDKESDRKPCFKLIYPITYVMPDGSAITGDNEKEVAIELKKWYESHPDSKAKPSLQYPVKIVYKTQDNVIMINSEEEMIRAKKSCSDGNSTRDRNRCFEFVYPVKYVMPDGTIITGENQKEIAISLKEWYANHPDSKAKPDLQYPIDVIFHNGQAITINDEAGMRRLKASCKDRVTDGIRDDRDETDKKCFDFIFPINYLMSDGSLISGDTREELARNFEAWYNDHPDSRESGELQFPVKIIYSDNSVRTIKSEDELAKAYRACE